MAYWIKHKFVSAKGDGTNTTLVRPSNWNDDHEFWMEEGTIIGRPPGSGPGPGQELPVSSLLPTGLITAFGGATAPTGWFLCHGSSLLRSEFPALFAVIGEMYGAADASHFSIPDLRGRVPAGVDPGTGRLTGGTVFNAHVVGGYGGTERHMLTPHELASHGHGDSGHNHPQYHHTHGSDLNGTGMNFATQISGQAFWQYTGGAGGPNELFVSNTTAGALADIRTGYANITATGGNGAHNNVQPTLTVNYIIKY